MRGRTPFGLAIGATAVAMIAAGCTSTPAETDETVSIIVDWGNPEQGLIPGATSEVQGGKVIDALFTGLINYDTETGAPVLVNAESITPNDDSTMYTVTLRSGWKWHDGTDVTAQNYVDAWNYTAYEPNGLQNGTFFADIEGYEDVRNSGPDPDEDGPQEAPPPAEETMSGLEVVDDLTFNVTLSGPSNLWPIKVGYSAFMPLPDVFFDDPEAFGRNPIGNGPFKLVSWTENVELKITKYEEYQGSDASKQLTDVTFRVYEEDTAAYSDVQAGTLDFQQQVPVAHLVGDKYATDFPDTSISKPVAVSEMMAIPFYQPAYQNVKLRQAISVAINREEITERIFNGSRIPMNGWVNPNVSGFEDGACGEFCTYDADRAKELLEEGDVTVNADGSFVSNGVTEAMLTIQYNADASHKDWVDATCNSIQEATGIKCEGKPIPTFAESRTIIEAHEATGMFRAGWQADYPSIENWLNPLLRTGGSSNDGLYSNSELDDVLAEADGTQDIEEAEALYREAELLLADEMPTIPMWHRAQQSVWGERMTVVPINIFGELVLNEVEVAAS